MKTRLPEDDLDLILSLTPEFWRCYSGARLFITGGTGFIGTWLLQALQRANDRLNSKIELLVLTRDPDYALQYAPRIFGRSDTSLIRGDVSKITAQVGKLDLCIHAAADVGNPLKAGHSIKVFDSIVLGTQRILELAHANGASRFLLTSSGAVYGPQPTNLERIEETYNGAPDPLQLSAAYGNGKRAAEWLTCAKAAQASQSGFQSCIARIFAVIGPGLPLNGPFAAGNFVRDVLAGNYIRIQGDGRPLRSYLYMADLCVWLFRILGGGTGGQAYNVGSETAVSIVELASQIVHAAHAAVPIQIMQQASFDMPAPRYVPNTFKARNELGLAEYTPLDTALFKTIQFTQSSLAR